jgi:hypothetical protein
MRGDGLKVDSTYLNSLANSFTVYESAFILLKDNLDLDGDLLRFYKHRIKYDKNKKKYYFSGRIIEWTQTTEEGRVIDSYPKYGTISMVDHRDWKMYSTVKYDKVKKEKIMNIHFSIIDFITVDFHSFDWKK